MCPSYILNTVFLLEVLNNDIEIKVHLTPEILDERQA
jgi:hypothetical protein